MMRSWGTAACLVLGDAIGLAVAPVPSFDRLAHHLDHPAAWLADTGAERATIALAGAALWLTAVWLGVGLGAAVVAGLPGTAGRMARHLAAVTLPRRWYRLLVGAAGLGAGAGILLGPVAAGAVTVPPPGATAVAPAPGTLPTTPRAGTSATAPASPQAGTAPAGTTRAGAAGAGTAGNRLPAPMLPLSAPQVSVPPVSGSPDHPTPPSTPPATPPPSDVHRSAPAGRPAATGTVTVQAGDSLWRIAEQHLPPHASGARIAQAWPLWWGANRAVIGADPDLLLPGQVLHTPAEFR